jgi:hypothetical protein
MTRSWTDDYVLELTHALQVAQELHDYTVRVLLAATANERGDFLRVLTFPISVFFSVAAICPRRDPH